MTQQAGAMKIQEWRPLRATLMHTMALTLQNRLMKLYQCQPQDPLFQTALQHHVLNEKGVLLPQVERQQQSLDPDGSGSSANGPHEALCGPAGRDHDGSGQHHQVPQPEAHRSEHDAVATGKPLNDSESRMGPPDPPGCHQPPESDQHRQSMLCECGHAGDTMGHPEQSGFPIF